MQNKAIIHLQELLHETKTALIEDTPREERFDKVVPKEIENEEAELRKEAAEEKTTELASRTSSSVSTPQTALPHMTTQFASTSSNLSTPATQFSDRSRRPSAPAAVYPPAEHLSQGRSDPFADVPGARVSGDGVIVVWHEMQIGVVRPNVNKSAGIVNTSKLRGREVNAQGYIFDASNTIIIAYATWETPGTIDRIAPVIRHTLR